MRNSRLYKHDEPPIEKSWQKCSTHTTEMYVYPAYLEEDALHFLLNFIV